MAGFAIGSSGAGITATAQNPNTSYINASGQKSPGVYVPSASNVGVNNSLQQSIKDQMNQNSQAWHAADSATKKQLEADNKRLAGQLGGSLNFNAGTGIWSGASGYDPYGDAMDKSDLTYTKIAAQAAAAKQAGVDRAVSGLEGQKTGINQSYSDLFKQLYVDKMQAQKNLPQQMAAMGYTGGLTESAAMDLQNSYANALRQGEQQRISSLSDIDRAMTDTRLQGDISIAEQAAQLAQQGLLSYTDILRAQQQQGNIDREYGWSRDQAAQAQKNTEMTYAMQQARMDLERDDVSYEKKLKSAQYLYEATGDASGFSMLGYTPQQIAAMGNSYAAMLARQNKAKSGSSGVSDKPKMTWNQVIENLDRGLVTPEVKTAFEYYQGISYDNYMGENQATKSISSYNQLGEAAKGIANNLSRSYGSAASKGQLILEAASRGTISEAEAQFLLDAIGAPNS